MRISSTSDSSTSLFWIKRSKSGADETGDPAYGSNWQAAAVDEWRMPFFTAFSFDGDQVDGFVANFCAFVLKKGGYGFFVAAFDDGVDDLFQEVLTSRNGRHRAAFDPQCHDLK